MTADLLVTARAVWVGGDSLTPGIALAVTGGTLSWVGEARRAPRAIRTVDVDGAVLPGLVDHHVHTSLIDTPALLDSGLTAVRDLGAPTDTVFDLAGRSRRAAFDGPRVDAAGPFLTAPGGYPCDRDWAVPGMACELPDSEVGVAAVRRLASYRPVTIKVALHATPGPPLADDVLAAIVSTAHGLGIPVTAHCEGAGQVLRAVAAGVDELAHAPFDEPLDDDVITRLAETVTIVSTVDIHGWGEDTVERSRAVVNLRRFHTAGGRVRYGTDLGNGPLPNGVNPREIAALVEAGLTPEEILAATTVEPLAAGNAADVVAVPTDPTCDPVALARAEPVLRAGRPRGRYRDDTCQREFGEKPVAESVRREGT